MGYPGGSGPVGGGYWGIRGTYGYRDVGIFIQNSTGIGSDDTLLIQGTLIGAGAELSLSPAFPSVDNSFAIIRLGLFVNTHQEENAVNAGGFLTIGLEGFFAPKEE